MTTKILELQFELKSVKAENKIENKDLHDLQEDAQKAHYAKTITEYSISEEKLLQEQLKTKEQYKEYILIDSLSVYFKLIEKIAKDTYIKIHSIIPEISALAKQNKTDDLEQFLLREVKNIFEVNIRETKKEINKDGFSF